MDVTGLLSPELGKVISSLIEPCSEIYLVGGVIRDYLLQRPNNDVDFVLKRNAILAAKTTANAFRGKFYVLDAERGTGRSLIEIDGEQIIVDFATINGGGIEDDLRKRDFTINAIAWDVSNPNKLIDPLHGEQDLHAAQLKPCSPLSFVLDPVRIIRAVRFIQGLDLTMSETSFELARQSVSHLAEVSLERKRDELFHIFETKGVRHSLKIMRELGLWEELFPSLNALEALNVIPPHVHSALDHTLSVLAYCSMFMESIRTGYIDSENQAFASACELLKEYRAELQAFLAQPIHVQRKYDGLLYLACLYHDIGKLEVEPLEKGDRTAFPEHAKVSARIYRKLSDVWALSKNENQFVERMIGNHTVSKQIRDIESEESRRALYRFYQLAGPSGVLISLLYLADILSTYEHTLLDSRWEQALDTSRALLEAWFHWHDQIVDPPVLLNGRDLIKQMNAKPGKVIGKALDQVREAQAGGVLSDRASALKYAEHWLDGEKG